MAVKIVTSIEKASVTNSEMLLEFANALKFDDTNTWFKKDKRKFIPS